MAARGRLMTLPLVAICSSLPAMARAATAIHADGYVVYPAVVDADAVPASVTRRLDLPRGHDWLVVDLSVMRGPDAAHGAPVAAHVQGAATTLLGKRLPLQFRIVRDDGPPHSLAVVQVTRPDTLRFSLRIAPQGTEPFAVDFTRDVR